MNPHAHVLQTKNYYRIGTMSTHLETHLLAELLPAPVVHVWVGLTFKIDLAVASTSRPECRFPCILASQFDAEEDRRRQKKWKHINM